MTTTRIDHTGHNHPSTTAARTACRKAMKATTTATPTHFLATVGKGKTVHTAELWNGVASSVRCGAGLGRGVKKNSPIHRLEDGTLDDVTCTNCRSHHGVAHN